MNYRNTWNLSEAIFPVLLALNRIYMYQVNIYVYFKFRKLDCTHPRDAAGI